MLSAGITNYSNDRCHVSGGRRLVGERTGCRTRHTNRDRRSSSSTTTCQRIVDTIDLRGSNDARCISCRIGIDHGHVCTVHILRSGANRSACDTGGMSKCGCRSNRPKRTAQLTLPRLHLHVNKARQGSCCKYAEDNYEHRKFDQRKPCRFVFHGFLQNARDIGRRSGAAGSLGDGARYGGVNSNRSGRYGVTGR